MIGPRPFFGIAIATATFLPIDKAVRIGLHVAMGRAARWHQTLDTLAIDFLQDLFFLVSLGLILLPLWILDFFLLRTLLRAGEAAWWIAAMSGAGVGLIWSLLPCGIYIFREHVSAGVYSQCVPGLSIHSPGVTGIAAGLIAGMLLYGMMRGDTYIRGFRVLGS